MSIFHVQRVDVFSSVSFSIDVDLFFVCTVSFFLVFTIRCEDIESLESVSECVSVSVMVYEYLYQRFLVS